MAEAPQTVLDVLYEWAALQKNQTIWSFLDDKGKVVDRVTYGELLNQAQALANHLHASGLQHGDRVMLVFFPSLQFTISLIGCFMAGVIAVPVFPPDPRRLRKDLNHFASIQQSSGATVALTQSSYNYAKKMTDIKNVFSRGPGDVQWPELRWIVVDSILSSAKAADLSALPRPSTSDIAFLQYTSGSTSDPKGVMIAHENLMHNLNLIVRDLQADASTVVVSWLPQYHDMGLIGSYLGILRCGGCGYYMSPFSFLKNPLVWLQSISTYRATHMQAPNFAYALTVRKFKEYSARSAGGLQYDLSCVRHMINAAEPVDEATIDNFYTIFQPFGLPDDVLYPTYGLAEHCVFVCSGGKQRICVQKSVLETEQRIVEVERGSDDSQVIVGCGFPFRGEGVRLLIVNHETLEVLGEDMVGEIWLDSPSKAKGYWGLEAQSREDFSAQPADSQHHTPTGYLRTGDLGFMHNEELFICGRLKDLIIVRGSNHYPQDLERTAEASHAGIRPGCSAAFQLADGSERVVLIAELRDDVAAQQHAAIADAIRSSVASGHGVALAAIVLLQPRSIPKTTSGKVARAWCRRAYVGGTLHALHSWQPAGHDGDLLVGAEGDDEANGEGGAATGAPTTCQPVAFGEALDRATIQSMSDEQLIATIEEDLVRVTSYAGPLPLDRNTPLVALGVDSLSLGQFKGLLEGRYNAQVPDEWMFSELATLSEMSVLVRNGSLTEAQQQALQQAMTAGPDQQQPNGPGAAVAGQKQPCCPWFTCCY